MGETLLDDHWVLEASDDFNRPATCPNVNTEDAFKALRPTHGCPAFSWRLVLRFIRHFNFSALSGDKVQKNASINTLNLFYGLNVYAS